MARYGPVDVVHWIAGYDMSGSGRIAELSDNLEVQTADVTPLGSQGGVVQHTPVGRVMYSASESGWFDDAEVSLRDLLKSGKPAQPWPSIIGYAGSAKGAPVRMATDLRIGQYDLQADVGDLTKASVEYFLNTGGKAYEGTLLVAGQRESDDSDSGSTPPAALVYDYGSAVGQTTNGGLAIIMLDLANSRFRGYPNIDLQLRDSANNTTWNFLTTNQRINRDSSSPFAVVEISGDIERYVAPRYNLSGTRDSFLTTAAFSSGDTEITVDAGTGTERLEVGDELLIGTGGTAQGGFVDTISESGGTWTIGLRTALAADIADNTAVAVTGDDFIISWAAALVRF